MNASIPLNWKLTYLFNSQKTQFVTQSSILKIPQLHTFPTEIASKIQHNDGINNIFSAENSKKPLEYEIDLENVKKTLCIQVFFIYFVEISMSNKNRRGKDTQRKKSQSEKRNYSVLYSKIQLYVCFFSAKTT